MEAKVGLITQVNGGGELNKRLHQDFRHVENSTKSRVSHTHSNEGNSLKALSKLGVCTACGVVFGIAADKGQGTCAMHACSYSSIIDAIVISSPYLLLCYHYSSCAIGYNQSNAVFPVHNVEDVLVSSCFK